MDADGWNERYRAVPLVWSATPNRWLVRETADLPPGHALDLAAGEGRNAIWLAERGWQVDALDFSSVAVERAERLASERGVTLSTRQVDLTEFSPTPDTYDLVLVSYLHLPHPLLNQVLRNAATAARPGGTLLLFGHDVTNLEHGTGGPPDPAVLTSPELVTAAWSEFADITSAEVETREVTTEAGTANALDTVVRAIRR